AEARERAGLTQEQVAEMIGVDRTTIIGWEKGRRHPRAHLPTLAKIYGVSTDDLYGLDAPEPTPAGDASLAERLLRILEDFAAGERERGIAERIRAEAERERVKAQREMTALASHLAGDVGARAESHS